MSFWNRIFGKGTDRANEQRPGSPQPAEVRPAPPGASPAEVVDNQDMASVSSTEAMRLRQSILSRHPLTKCCDLAPIDPRKVGTGHLGILRVVLYRLDGKTIEDSELDAVIMLFVMNRAATDPDYAPVLQSFVDGTFFPHPRIGFSIDLSSDSAEDRIAQCEVLAVTEYSHEGGDFRTTGHGLHAEGVPYRIYFFWKA